MKVDLLNLPKRLFFSIAHPPGIRNICLLFSQLRRAAFAKTAISLSFFALQCESKRQEIHTKGGDHSRDADCTGNKNAISGQLTKNVFGRRGARTKQFFAKFFVFFAQTGAFSFI
ncbi:MAG TPA: hypothetical protein H9883_09205 [Candidatus Ruthenibacterium merdigallinarum]|nr:hypothetical protein [Candidatus Ruthenibacterium merdigallinarum]